MTNKETKLRKTVVAHLRDTAKRVNKGKLGEYHMNNKIGYLDFYSEVLSPTYINVEVKADILT